MAADPLVWHPCYGPPVTLQLVGSDRMADEEEGRSYPVEFEGERFYRGRTKVSGTADAPAPLHRGDEVAHLVVSHVKDVRLGLHEKVPTVVYGLDARESYEVPLDQVDQLLAEARRLARQREDEATGQQPLLDELEAERAAADAVGADADGQFPPAGVPVPRPPDSARKVEWVRYAAQELNLTEEEADGYTKAELITMTAGTSDVEALEAEAPDDELPEGVSRIGDVL